MPNLRVEPLSALPPSSVPAVARVFVEAYAADLASISRDQRRWAAALEPAFVPERFWVALDGGEVLGIAAVSHQSRRAMALDAGALRRHLGVVRGTVASLVMRRTFHRAVPYPATTGYVECVATATAARGRGVATTLMRHLETLPYDELVLEVTDANEGARRLYQRLGYEEIGRRRSRAPRLTGYREALVLRRRTSRVA